MEKRAKIFTEIFLVLVFICGVNIIQGSYKGGSITNWDSQMFLVGLTIVSISASLGFILIKR